MKILLANDDGYFAEGIKAIQSELSSKHDITVIAPDRERSSCGHALSLNVPLRLIEVAPKSFKTNGYPADCILLGLGSIFKEKRPDLVLSGINHGPNLGQDCFYSGTMAAAREAIFRDIPAISISLANCVTDGDNHFSVGAKIISQIIESAAFKNIPSHWLININLPNLAWENIAGVKRTRAGFQRYSETVIQRNDLKDRCYYWIGGKYEGHDSIEGSDCNAISEGYISVEFKDLSSDITKTKDQTDSFSSLIDELDRNFGETK